MCASITCSQPANRGSATVIEANAVLFDLDGTLVDTAPDMVRAVNALLVAEGRTPQALADLRPHVSNGAAGLLAATFGCDGTEDEQARLNRAFLELYATDLARESALFPGMEALLAELERIAIPWGIVTNKPGWLTQPLAAALGLQERASCIVSGDTIAQRKPDPAPIVHACNEIGVSPTATVYLGDAKRDIVAGRSAGARTLVALFGYLEPGAQPAAWGADAMLATPAHFHEHVTLGAGTRITG